MRVRRYKEIYPEMTIFLHGRPRRSRKPSRALIEKTSTARGENGAGKVSKVVDSDKVGVLSVANNEADRRVGLSEEKTMIDQADKRPEKKKESQVAETAEMAVINAMEMCSEKDNMDLADHLLHEPFNQWLEMCSMRE